MGVVDDSVTFRRILESFFNDLGHKVIGCAQSGKEAIEMYVKHKPDLVTMDISMPNIDGLEITSMMTKLYPDVKIIIVTIHGEKGVLTNAIKSGAASFVRKPITKDKLEKAIEKAIFHE